ncbi:hypothetical protein [Pedobacter sp. V48]|uniref:PRC-barrel domain-containing protein n=1 Tax=Pedobacter sp. V48 TaxID=509635 RepID=UPI0003E4AD64|nr:hypothetical protein [Pedobacter sp. V48]ETZ19570.1 hypothetical protein N824_12575 [Pedobacter sp. V48]
MLKSIQHLIGSSVKAKDGKFGVIKDIYFDDNTWNVRYLIVEARWWLLKHQWVISPFTVLQTGLTESSIQVTLTNKEIRQYPVEEASIPVSKQEEESLFNHHSWPDYSSRSMFDENLPRSFHSLRSEDKDQEYGDPHLRSFTHVRDYTVSNSDGFLGEVEDFLVDTVSWKISNLVIQHFFDPEEFNLIPVKKVRSINWDNFQLEIDLASGELEHCQKTHLEDFTSAD